MCMISQEALGARNRASANNASFPGTAFQDSFTPSGYSGPATTQALPYSSGYAAKDEYRRNELALTIRHLVAGSSNGRWEGTLDEILAAAQAENWLVGATIRQISWQIWALEGFLSSFDNIHHYEWRQDGQVKHFFYVCKVDDGAKVHDSYPTKAESSVIDDKALALYVDGINKTHYEENDAYARCPGYLLNNMLGHPDCPNKPFHNRCAFLDYQRVAYHGEYNKGAIELMFGITIELPCLVPHPAVPNGYSRKQRLQVCTYACLVPRPTATVPGRVRYAVPVFVRAFGPASRTWTETHPISGL